MKHNCFSTSTVLDFAMHMKKKKNSMEINYWKHLFTFIGIFNE